MPLYPAVPWKSGTHCTPWQPPCRSARPRGSPAGSRGGGSRPLPDCCGRVGPSAPRQPARSPGAPGGRSRSGARGGAWAAPSPSQGHRPCRNEPLKGVKTEIKC